MVQAGLGKQSTAMRTMRPWATRRGLTPSETAYLARTRDRRQLRFSVSGQPDIERAYHTHWVSPDLSARKAERLRKAAAQPPDLVVVDSLTEWTCAGCATSGEGLLLMQDDQPLCLRCSRLDHLIFLPAGDATRTDGRIAPAPGPRSWSTSAGPASATNDRVYSWNPMR